jgi:hypothetical protein
MNRIVACNLIVFFYMGYDGGVHDVKNMVTLTGTIKR